MARFADTAMYELSPEIEIYWGGMRGDSRTMQRWGWEFAVDAACWDSQSTSVIARNKASGVALMGSVSVDELMRARHGRYMHQKPIEMNGVRFFGPDQRLVVMGSLDHKFDRVDMMPSLSERQARSLLDVFTPWAPDAEEIIVDPPTVAGLLEQIRSLQEPELAEIRKRNRAREYRQGDQREVVRAQILTFAA